MTYWSQVKTDRVRSAESRTRGGRRVRLLARTAGLLGHLAEEQRHPLGMDVYLTVDRNAEYQAPES